MVLYNIYIDGKEYFPTDISYDRDVSLSPCSFSAIFPGLVKGLGYGSIVEIYRDKILVFKGNAEKITKQITMSGGVSTIVEGRDLKWRLLLQKTPRYMYSGSGGNPATGSGAPSDIVKDVISGSGLTKGVIDDYGTTFAYASPSLIDSWNETHQDSWGSIRIHPSIGEYESAYAQSFTMISSTVKLTSCKFFLKKLGLPVGLIHAALYSHTGNYGAGGLPNALLATSDDFQASDLTTDYALYTFTFSGNQQYVMTANTYYCIVLLGPSSGTFDDTNKVIIGKDNTPGHSGNGSYYNGYFGGWYFDVVFQFDLVFYLYGQIYSEVPLTITYPVRNYTKDKILKELQLWTGWESMVTDNGVVHFRNRLGINKTNEIKFIRGENIVS